MSARRRAVTLLVVEERPSFAEALAVAVGVQRGVRAAGSASTAHDATALARKHRPDVVLASTDLVGTRPAELVRTVLSASPESAFLVLVDRQSDLAIAEAVDAGAVGYVRAGEPVARIAEVVQRAAGGERLIGPEEARRLLRLMHHRRGGMGAARERADRLTRREVEILQHMADGLPPSQISLLLGLSPGTLRTHVQNILTKLSVHSKTEALAFAIRHGKVAAR